LNKHGACDTFSALNPKRKTLGLKPSLWVKKPLSYRWHVKKHQST